MTVLTGDALLCRDAMVLPGSWSEESAVPAGMAWGLACLVLGNRLAGRSGQDGLQICCGGFDRPVDARLADRVEKAAVADVTDRPAPPRLVGQVLQDLAGSGPWSGISVPSTPGTTSMVQVGARTARDRAGLRSPGAVPGPRRPG
jgi:hypothetical protein